MTKVQLSLKCRFWIVLISILITGILISLLNPKDSGQVYNGKTMEEWFEIVPKEYAYMSTNGLRHYSDQSLGRAIQDLGPPPPRYIEAKQALDAFEWYGTNAIPFLLSKMQNRDSPFELAVIKWANQLGVSRAKLPFRSAKEEVAKATGVFFNSRLFITNAAPHFSSLTNSPNSLTRDSAAWLCKVLNIMGYRNPQEGGDAEVE